MWFTGLPNFKKVMATLILAPANYLLDIVSPGGPTMFGAGMKILGFGVPKWPENAFLSLVPWTYQCAKAPHFRYREHFYFGKLGMYHRHIRTDYI